MNGLASTSSPWVTSIASIQSTSHLHPPVASPFDSPAQLETQMQMQQHEQQQKQQHDHDHESNMPIDNASSSSSSSPSLLQSASATTSALAPALAPAPSTLAASSCSSSSSSSMLCLKPLWVHHNSRDDSSSSSSSSSSLKPTRPLPIYSIDLSPDSTRFVTSGGDQLIKIWSLKPLEDEAAERDPNQPKLLATLANHTTAVNVVKFSHCGNYIASGADGDAPSIIIYQLASLQRSSSNSSASSSSSSSSSLPFGVHVSTPNYEDWNVIAQLRGHTADIQDVCWSPDDSQIASCSVDNSVRIWNVQDRQMVAVLKGHSGWVKGVAWDPIGMYVASEGLDGSVIIWDTRSWSEKKRLTAEFQTGVVDRAGETTALVRQIVFTRLSWSPCGSFLGTSRGWQDQKIAVSPIYMRGTWARKCVYVGHTHATTVTRFNPRLFTKQTPQPSTTAANGHTSAPSSSSSSSSSSSTPLTSPARTTRPSTRTVSRASESLSDQRRSSSSSSAPFSLCAVGSMDSTVSVWSSLHPQPLVHCRSWFAGAVEDVCWSSDGLTLLACSHDGGVAMWRFTMEQIGGVQVSREEEERIKRVKYGGIKQMVNMELPESVETMQMHKEAQRKTEEEQKRKTAAAAIAQAVSSGNSIAQNNAPVQQLTASEVAAKQQVIRGKDGKRRIVPINLEAHQQQQQQQQQQAPPATATPSITNTETVHTLPSATSSSKNGTSSTLNGSHSSSNNNTSVSQASNKKQRLDSQSNGTARRTSALPPSSSSTSTSSSTSAPSSSASTSSSSIPPAAAARPSRLPRAPAAPRFLVAPASVKANLVCELPMQGQEGNPSFNPFHPPLSSSSTVSSSPLSASFPSSASSRGRLQIEVSVDTTRSISTLICKQCESQAVEWCTQLSGQITLIRATAHIIVAVGQEQLTPSIPANTTTHPIHSHSASTSNGHSTAPTPATGVLYLLSPSGRRLLPPLHLSSLPSFLTSSPSTHTIALLTSDAQLRLYDLSLCSGAQGLGTAPRCSLSAGAASLLGGGGVKVVSLTLTRPQQEGREGREGEADVGGGCKPVIGLSNSSCYLYDAWMQGWIRITDRQAQATAHHHSAHTQQLLHQATAGTLPTLTSSADSASIPAGLLPPSLASSSSSSSSFSSALSSSSLPLPLALLSQLEDALSLSLLLHSSALYHAALTNYVSKLVQIVEANNNGPVEQAFGGVGGGGGAREEGRVRAMVGSSAVAMARLQEVCEQLMGPIHSSSSSGGSGGGGGGEGGSWIPMVLGWSKRELLRDLVPLLSQSRQLSRFTVQLKHNLQQAKEYQERIEQANSSMQLQP